MERDSIIAPAYFNVGPPRPQRHVCWSIKPVCTYEIFTLREVAENYFQQPDVDIVSLTQRYIKDHQEMLYNIPVPQSFIFAQAVNSHSSSASSLNEQGKQCNDFHRTLAIVGRIVNDIYIPSRRLDLPEEAWSKNYYLPLKELQS